MFDINKIISDALEIGIKANKANYGDGGLFKETKSGFTIWSPLESLGLKVYLKTDEINDDYVYSDIGNYLSMNKNFYSKIQYTGNKKRKERIISNTKSSILPEAM